MSAAAPVTVSLPSPPLLASCLATTWPVFPVCLSFSLGPFVNGFGGSFGARRTCAHIFRYYNVVHTYYYSLCHWPISFGYFYQQRHQQQPQPTASSSAFLKGQFPIVRFDFISKLMKWHKSIKTTAAEAWHRSKLAQDSLLAAAFEQWQCAVINTLTIIPCSYWMRWKLFIVHWSRDWLQDHCAHF